MQRCGARAMERRQLWPGGSPTGGNMIVPFQHSLLQMRRGMKDDGQDMSPMHAEYHISPLGGSMWTPIQQHDGWKQAEATSFRQAKWTELETLVLVESRRRQVEKMGGWNGPPASADEKWTIVAEEMVAQGVTDKDKTRCRQKWENLKRDYKKVKYRNPPGKPAYWDMTPRERKEHGLPSYFSDRVFLALEEWLGDQPNLNPEFSVRRLESSANRADVETTPGSAKKKRRHSYDAEVSAFVQAAKVAVMEELEIMEHRMQNLEELLEKQTEDLLEGVNAIASFEAAGS